MSNLSKVAFDAHMDAHCMLQKTNAPNILIGVCARTCTVCCPRRSPVSGSVVTAGLRSAVQRHDTSSAGAIRRRRRRQHRKEEEEEVWHAALGSALRHQWCAAMACRAHSTSHKPAMHPART